MRHAHSPAGTFIRCFGAVQWNVVLAVDTNRQEKQDVATAWIVQRADVRGQRGGYCDMGRQYAEEHSVAR